MKALVEPTRSTAEQRARYEREQLEARTTRLLIGGLTSQGDAFLIGVAAVFLMIALYPLVDAWSLLAFPAVLVVALVGRRMRSRRPN